VKCQQFPESGRGFAFAGVFTAGPTGGLLAALAGHFFRRYRVVSPMAPEWLGAMASLAASVAILSGVLGMAGAATVYAGSSPQSDDHARRSLATALNEHALPVLVRCSPRAPDATLSSLITSVTRADRTLPVEQQSREFERGRVLVTGKDWKARCGGSSLSRETGDPAEKAGLVLR
jgi:hypothetical protein